MADENQTNDIQAQPEPAPSQENGMQYMEPPNGNNFLDEQDSFGSRFKESLVEFEENHPILFFGFIAVIIFMILLLVVMPFMGDDDDEQRQETTEQAAQEPAEETQPSVASPLGEGISAALYYSDIANLNQLTAANLDFLDIEQTFDADAFLANELVLARQIEEAYSIDIQELMTMSNDKEDDFDQYLESLQTLEQRASIEYLSLQETHETFRKRIEMTENQKNATLQTLNAALETGSPDQISETLERYVTLQESLAKLKVRDQITVDVMQALRPTLVQVRARIAGLIANRELVIQNLTAIDVDDSGLLIIQEGNLQQYYPPLPGTENIGEGSGSGSSGPALYNDDSIPRVQMYGWEEFKKQAQEY